jgi:hypothetical protein
MISALLFTAAAGMAAAVQLEPVPFEVVLGEFRELGLENCAPIVCTGPAGDSIPAVYACSLPQSGPGFLVFLDSDATGLQGLLIHRDETGEPVTLGFDACGPFGWWLWEFRGAVVGDEDGDGFDDLRVNASWITGIGSDGAVPFGTESVLLWAPAKGVFAFSGELSGY